ESEKKQKEIELKDKQNQLQKLEIDQQQDQLDRQKIIIVAGILVLIIILFFLTVVKRQNTKIKKAYELLGIRNVEILQQKEEIESQRDEIEAQRDLATQQRDQIEKQNIRITDSIEYASRIQSAMLPPDEFIKETLNDYFIYFKPRDIVSGDFYWMMKKDNLTVIAAVDCTGHGVPGAFMSMLGVALLNEIIGKDDLSNASKILQKLRENVIKSLHQTGDPDEAADGMDIALSIIDFQKKEMQFSGANNPLYIIRNKELIEIKSDKMPLGIHFIEDEPFTNHEIKLKSNDLLYIFSDGYVDQFGGKDNRKLLARNFKKVLVQNCEKPLDEQKILLDEYLNEWKGDMKQIDDILIIGLKIS
ncbi:PP2C family protein-serine/threonine phosphatase, partial [Bacteroidota bacterium]